MGQRGPSYEDISKPIKENVVIRHVKVKHFQVDRTDKLPDWRKAEEFLNTIDPEKLVNVSTYPTGNHHNMVVVYHEFTEPETGTSIPEGP